MLTNKNLHLKCDSRAPFNIFFSHFNLGSNLLSTKHNAVKYNIDSETSTWNQNYYIRSFIYLYSSLKKKIYYTWHFFFFLEDMTYLSLQIKTDSKEKV